MIERIRSFIEQYHMIQPGDTVVAGVSGGADSVCLLFVLLQLQKEIPFHLTAVHLNHRIRPEAGKDAAFVEALCERWSCPCRSLSEDVEAFAAKERCSIEEAGRRLRYRSFERVLRELGAPEGKIAVAHNQNDNAETVLFHLLRGTGLLGLCGIHPVRGNVIRPLLCVEREEIEQLLQENQISFCIDKTNQEDTYTRNRIRHHILAYAQEQICERAVAHIYDTTVTIRKAQRYLDRQTSQALERCLEAEREAAPERAPERLVFRVAAFLAEDSFLQEQMLLEAMERLSGSRKDLGAVHVRALQELFVRAGNRQIQLPYGLRGRREYDRMILAAWQEEAAAWQEEVSLCIPGSTVLPDGRKVICELFPWEKSRNIPQKIYTKWFDYDKIKKSLLLRTRRAGDYLTVCREGGRKSLKRYLIDEKVPMHQREQQLLLAEEAHILWVVGRRVSEYYKITEETETVLQVQLVGGTSDGRENPGTVSGRGSR